MAHRLLVQVIFTGARVFGRAFTEAYREAAAVSTAQQTQAKTGKAQSAQARDTGITLDEATKILDVDLSGLTLETAEKKYSYLFDINSKEKGGSFYVQSKVYRSLERIKKELDYIEDMQKAKEESPESKSEESKKD